MPPEGLKLRAVDAEDIEILAVLLQDAIVPASDMLYRTEESSFVLVLQRFLWDECEAEKAEEKKPSFLRVCSALEVTGVTKARLSGFKQGEEGVLLDLLTFTLDQDEIAFVFAGGASLRLALGPDWSLKLRDFGEPWPVLCRPEHAERAGKDTTKLD